MVIIKMSEVNLSNIMKEINEQKRKQTIQKYYRNIIFYETCELYWYHKQKDILDFIYDNSNLFKNKNVLVVRDNTGLCNIILTKIGANVFVKETNFLFLKNMKINSIQPKIYIENNLDYIVDIGDNFVLQEELNQDTKLFIALPKKPDLNLSIYFIQQISPYRTEKNTLFEIQKNKVSWLL